MHMMNEHCTKWRSDQLNVGYSTALHLTAMEYKMYVHKKRPHTAAITTTTVNAIQEYIFYYKKKIQRDEKKNVFTFEFEMKIAQNTIQYSIHSPAS